MTLEELRECVDLILPEKKLGKMEPTYFWATLLRACVTESPMTREVLQIPKTTCFVFTGPVGNGRHSTAEALVGSLCMRGENLTRHILQRSGWELDHEEEEEVTSFVENVVRLTHEYGSMCLVLDEPENCRHNMLLQGYLGQLVELTEVELYLVIISQKQESVHPCFLRSGLVCHCAPPDRDDRRKWLSAKLKKPVKLPLSGIDLKELADKTEGFSWKQLQDLILCMRMELFVQTLRDQKKLKENDLDLETAVEEGFFKLSGDAVRRLVNHIGNAASAVAVGPMMQMVAGMPIAVAAEETKAVTEEKVDPGNNADLQKQADKHKNPESMSADELLNVDNI